MKLLLTGFEPFGGSSANPSEQVAHELEGKTIAACKIFAVILPVEAGRMTAALFKAIDSTCPDAVLGLGEAPRRPVVSVERVAVNLQDYSIPDNKGRQLNDKPIRNDGPAAYFSTLPVRKILTALQAAGIPSEISLSAGAYLCNHLMYLLLDRFADSNPSVPVGFIHLPSLPEQVLDKRPQSASMSLEMEVKAVSIAIEVIAKNFAGKNKRMP